MTINTTQVQLRGHEAVVQRALERRRAQPSKGSLVKGRVLGHGAYGTVYQGRGVLRRK